MLRRTLESIYRQQVPFEFETIVVDDGTIDSQAECSEFPVRWTRIAAERRHTPAEGRNSAYRQARGEVIISQSDDVMHHSKDCIERLVTDLRPETFLIATVINVTPDGTPYLNGKKNAMTSVHNQRPYLFLGSVCRQHVWAINGCDEDFGPAGEDAWFAQCLIGGLGLNPDYSSHIVGWHQHHDRADVRRADKRARHALWRKHKHAKTTGRWVARKGMWT